jgi:outer membrane immunogenic protein
VWGLEADFSGLTTKASRSSSAVSPTTGNTFTAEHSTAADALMTVRPRLGMLYNDNTLLYITGGLAIAHLNASGGETGQPGVPQYLGSGSVSQWTYGWTIGGGVEAKIGGPWSVKAEYLYVDLRAVDYHVTQSPANANNGFINIGDGIAVPTQLHIFRVGVNYKWGDSENWVRANAALTPPVYNWTGLYAGAHMGGSWGTTRATDLSNFNLTGDVINARTSGIIGGVQVGYNWQANMIVFGVEADFGYLGFRGTAATTQPDVLGSATASGGLYGTFRGRVGVAWDRTLFYLTGGLIVADVGANVNNPFNRTQPGDPNALVGDEMIFTGKTGAQLGWTLGGGAEYALDHGWSIKGEYLHFDLGTKQVAGSVTNPFDPAGPRGFGVPFAFDIRNTGDFVRLGVNRKIF